MILAIPPGNEDRAERADERVVLERHVGETVVPLGNHPPDLREGFFRVDRAVQHRRRDRGEETKDGERVIVRLGWAGYASRRHSVPSPRRGEGIGRLRRPFFIKGRTPTRSVGYGEGVPPPPPPPPPHPPPGGGGHRAPPALRP